jgi:hypothetical protein
MNCIQNDNFKIYNKYLVFILVLFPLFFLFYVYLILFKKSIKQITNEITNRLRPPEGFRELKKIT